MHDDKLIDYASSDTDCCAERNLIWKTNQIDSPMGCTIVVVQLSGKKNKYKISRSEPCKYCTTVIKNSHWICRVVYSTRDSFVDTTPDELPMEDLLETKNSSINP